MKKCLLTLIVGCLAASADAIIITRAELSGSLVTYDPPYSHNPVWRYEPMTLTFVIDAAADRILSIREILEEPDTTRIDRVQVTWTTSLGSETLDSQAGEVWYQRAPWYGFGGGQMSFDYHTGIFFGQYSLSGDIGVLDDCFLNISGGPYSYHWYESVTTYRIPDSGSSLLFFGFALVGLIFVRNRFAS